jgi:hypothetical protein
MQLMLSEHFLLLKYCPLITVRCTAYFAFTGIYTTTTRTVLPDKEQLYQWLICLLQKQLYKKNLHVSLAINRAVPVDDEAVLEKMVELFF